MPDKTIRVDEEVFSELVKVKANEEARTGQLLTMNEAIMLAIKNGKGATKPVGGKAE